MAPQKGAYFCFCSSRSLNSTFRAGPSLPSVVASLSPGHMSGPGPGPGPSPGPQGVTPGFLNSVWCVAEGAVQALWLLTELRNIQIALLITDSTSSTTFDKEMSALLSMLLLLLLLLLILLLLLLLLVVSVTAEKCDFMPARFAGPLPTLGPIRRAILWPHLGGQGRSNQHIRGISV